MAASSSSSIFSSDSCISFDLYIKDIEKISWCLSDPLESQHLFEKIASPWEMQQWGWTHKELQKFTIDVEKIDRVYFLRVKTVVPYTVHCYQLIARINTQSEQLPIYVELLAKSDAARFDYPGCMLGCHGCGYIFISRDINLFMKLVLAPRTNSFITQANREFIYEVLEMDLEKDENIEKTNKNQPKTLQYHCHAVVLQNRDDINVREYASLLPKKLVNSVEDFIKTNEAYIAYNAKNRCTDNGTTLPTKKMKKDSCVNKIYWNCVYLNPTNIDCSLIDSLWPQC